MFIDRSRSRYNTLGSFFRFTMSFFFIFFNLLMQSDVFLSISGSWSPPAFEKARYYLVNQRVSELPILLFVARFMLRSHQVHTLLMLLPLGQAWHGWQQVNCSLQ